MYIKEINSAAASLSANISAINPISVNIANIDVRAKSNFVATEVMLKVSKKSFCHLRWQINAQLTPNALFLNPPKARLNQINNLQIACLKTILANTDITTLRLGVKIV
jgi:hypothetical protein